MPLFAKVKNCELSSLKIRCLHPPKVFFSIFTKIFLQSWLPSKAKWKQISDLIRFSTYESNIMFVVAVWTEYRAPAPLKCLSLGFFLLLVSTEHPSFVYGIIWMRDRTLFFSYNTVSDFTGSRFTLTFESPNSYDVRCLTSQILYFVSFQRHHHPKACLSKVRDFSGLFWNKTSQSSWFFLRWKRVKRSAF